MVGQDLCHVVLERAFRECDVVCFDVDCTLQPHDSLDLLAEKCGEYQKVMELSAQAMDGHLGLKDSLHMSLDLIRPPLKVVEELASEPVKVTAGAFELIKRLKEYGIKVFLVSGGFRRMIEPLAKHLGISSDNIFANSLIFKDGIYQGFDETQPTSRSHGKLEVIREIGERYNDGKVIMIGDGITDLETMPLTSLFVGFGGIEEREVVKKEADVFVTSFSPLIDAFEAARSNIGTMDSRCSA